MVFAHVCQLCVQVSSTESGEIFGTIAYDATSTVEKSVINLNGIKIDILDYIQPATCTDAAFRAMWADFEWENKVAVNTPLRSVSPAPRPYSPLTRFTLWQSNDCICCVMCYGQ